MLATMGYITPEGAFWELGGRHGRRRRADGHGRSGAQRRRADGPGRPGAQRVIGAKKECRHHRGQGTSKSKLQRDHGRQDKQEAEARDCGHGHHQRGSHGRQHRGCRRRERRGQAGPRDPAAAAPERAGAGPGSERPWAAGPARLERRPVGCAAAHPTVPRGARSSRTSGRAHDREHGSGCAVDRRDGDTAPGPSASLSMRMCLSFRVVRAGRKPSSYKFGLLNFTVVKAGRKPDSAEVCCSRVSSAGDFHQPGRGRQGPDGGPAEAGGRAGGWGPRDPCGSRPSRGRRASPPLPSPLAAVPL
mmetsp:Transcript_72643/g.206162  ORF Transcript_72643/g.206162 Transcript_72643/m.206162 type:complete len:303 (-) Transcript_72643:127-1035(-)